MRQTIYSILFAGTAITMLPGCESETGFTMNPGEGQLNCESLSVDYINQQTRAQEVNGISVNDFTVDFIETNTPDTPTKTYKKYSEMPEIVTLPAGSYSVKAHYGENEPASWDAPYYNGSLDGINIIAGQITTLPEERTITCHLSNIRVNVNFEDFGKGLIEDDAQVVVSAGEAGTTLTFFKDKTKQEGTVGYFKAVTGSTTITAVFTGTLEKTQVNKAITFSDAAPGKSYTINFTVTKPESSDSQGTITPGGGINIDTTISVDDGTTFDPNPDKPHDVIDGN